MPPVEDGAASTTNATERTSWRAGPGATQAVVRALTILELLSPDEPQLRVRELAERSGLNRVTTYRMCRTLDQLGYLRTTADGRYEIGVRCLTLSTIAAISNPLRQKCAPHLADLQREVQATADLGVLLDADIVYLARMKHPGIVDIQLSVGSRTPVSESSLGHAIASQLPASELDVLIDRTRSGFGHRLTGSGEAELRKALDDARELGYSIDAGRFLPGVAGMAMPLCRSDGYPIAAVSVTTPVELEVDQVLRRYRGPLASAVGLMEAEMAAEADDRPQHS